MSTFGLQIVEGRNLLPSDTIREFILNETAVHKLGLKNNAQAVGNYARVNGKTGLIVGVVKDFHNKSLHQLIDPVCISTAGNYYSDIAIRVNTQDLKAGLAQLQGAWQKIFPDQLYKYEFLDDRIGRFYQGDQLLLRMVETFAAIAILIGCLGLYGLVSFMSAQKNREVGVRKVLGASVQSILWLFGKEFAGMLLIAFAIAGPSAWLLMDRWLDRYPYRINIGIGIFGLAILINVLITLLTVGYRALRSARMNPAQMLQAI